MAKMGNNASTEQGELLTINKNLLTIAPEYQRGLSKISVKRIEQNWKWRAAGVVTVSFRNGKYYVVDGQHRVEAAKNITEITHIPCLVFKNLNLADEAKTFVDINSGRRGMCSVEKFRAAITQGDEIATYVNNRIEANKFHVAKSGFHSVNCVKTLCDIASKSKTRFDRVLDFACKICRNKQLNRKIFDAIAYVDERGILDDRLKDRLMTVGYDTLLVSIKQSNIAFGTLKAKSCAHGLLEAANKNMRNKFEIEL